MQKQIRMFAVYSVLVAAILLLLFASNTNTPSFCNTTLHAASDTAYGFVYAQDQPQNPPDGSTYCQNYDSKNKKANCRCSRPCVDGKPGLDGTCVNHCKEDRCKCRTKCDS